MDYGEKRSHKRFLVQGLEGSLLAAQDVTIGNISFDGVQVQTSKRLAIGQVYSIRVKAGSVNLVLKGQTAWCTLKGSRTIGDGQSVPIYVAGLQFQDEKKDMLRRFIEENRAKRLEQRIGSIRFNISGRHEASVLTNCKVRKVSRGGMEIIACEGFTLDSKVDVDLTVSSGTIGITCRVASITVTASEDQPCIGLEFISFLDDGEGKLNKFIDELEAE